MSEQTCTKFAWCDVEGESTWHRYRYALGIEFIFDEAEHTTHVSWQPNWSEWTIQPGMLRTELRELRRALSSLEANFEQFAAVVGVNTAPAHAVEDLRPCAQHGCITAVHPYVNGERDEPHLAARLDHPDGHYSVLAQTEGNSPEYVTWADVHQIPDGADGLAALDQLRCDYQQLLEHAERLNNGAPTD